jgi:His-Xaa-Ser system protein HxsD
MQHFLSKNIENDRMELLIDTNIFSQNIAMKAAYTFLDRAYFFFHSSQEWLLVQITPKSSETWDAEKFALEYSDELLAYYLRTQVEIENKVVRETIVHRALGSYADLPNFVSIEPNAPQKWQIDFDRDINEILKDIENDPDLKIDEDEINRILAEIESETQALKKPKLDPNKLKNVKKNFSRK